MAPIGARAWELAARGGPVTGLVSDDVWVIGIGRMGLPICSALVESGFEVIASDLRDERARDVRSVGGRWETEQTSLVARADVLITVLPGFTIVGGTLEQIGALTQLAAADSASFEQRAVARSRCR